MNPNHPPLPERDLVIYLRLQAEADTHATTAACDALDLVERLAESLFKSEKQTLALQAQLSEMAVVLYELKDLAKRINKLP